MKCDIFFINRGWPDSSQFFDSIVISIELTDIKSGFVELRVSYWEHAFARAKPQFSDMW